MAQTLPLQGLSCQNYTSQSPATVFLPLARPAQIPAGMRELTLEEIDLVAAGIRWRAAFEAGIEGAIGGAVGGAAYGGIATAMTGGALWPSIGIGFAAGGGGGFLGGFAVSMYRQLRGFDEGRPAV